MPTDVLEAAMSQLVTNFRTIGNGAVTTWAQSVRPQVSRNKPDPQAIASTPSIWLWRHTETFITDSMDEGVSTGANIYAIECLVDVAFYTDSATWNADTDLSKWRHDLIKAVRDHRLGGNIHDLRIVSLTSGLPDPEDPACRINMQLRLRYQQNEDDPSVQIA